MKHRWSPKYPRTVMQVTLLALLAGCGIGGADIFAAAPPAVAAPPSRPAAAAQKSGNLQAAMLSAHNDARAAVGVGPVVWDANLTAAAAAHARQLAASGRFEHSSDASRTNQGENLWAGTAGAFSFRQMADGWIDERRFFVAGVFPQVSRTGKWQDVGHYTQIIWRNTSHIGCAIASNDRRDILVCRYGPPGNFTGQRAF